MATRDPHATSRANGAAEARLRDREILAALRKLRRGELDVRLPDGYGGIDGQICDAFNEVAQIAEGLAEDVASLRAAIGEGKTARRLSRAERRGAWRRIAENVDFVLDDLTDHASEVARVVTAMAVGDFTARIDAGSLRGEPRRHARAVNAVAEQLTVTSEEVARIAREIGIEGKLGAQVEGKGARGAWKELIEDVNLLAGSLTNQVRDLAQVTTAVARGDLSRKVTVDVRGEILEVKSTINTMIDQIEVFAAELIRIAREVGTEGKLGGRIGVPGVAGIWKDIIDNVNLVAHNVTVQVRSIARVVTAVAEGDLAQKLQMEAGGEMATLRDHMNHMIRALDETTRVNQEQDWLKTNLARFTRMLQGQRDVATVARRVIEELAPSVGAQHGVFHVARRAEGRTTLRLVASYAAGEGVPAELAVGEGLAGQAAATCRRILVDDVPEGYAPIASALGRARPACVVVVPVLFEGEVRGVVELASFQRFGAVQLAFLDQFAESLGIVLASLEAQMKTDELLRRSQELAEELGAQKEELETKARQLFAQKGEVERKNQEIELARRELEEKAEQLALTSRYKSQFLANMSHELRTPLNSLLILSRQLADNRQGNLDERQIHFARTIHQAGADLLELIDEILDLAKIESGTMKVNLGEVGFEELRDHLERTFRHVAEERRLAFSITLHEGLPASITTDEMRLKQILRNLLSNAFKFTDRGSVDLSIVPAAEVPGLAPGEVFVAFAVKDSGIGIAPDQQRLVFEAFQQADGTATRRYGGTGLGLAISRELAGLLGGDVRLESQPGLGSTFTLYLPRASRPRTRSEAPPRAPAPPEPLPAIAARPPASAPEERPGARMLLVVAEDDVFARTLVELARQRGLCGVIAQGGAEALELAEQVKPDAIALDLDLPDAAGWVLLDRLKHDPRTRHVPVLVLSTREHERRARATGALGFLAKPASGDELLAALDDAQALLDRSTRRLLIVAAEASQIREIAGGGGVESTVARGHEEALAALDRARYDCVVVDLAADGRDLLEAMERRPDLARTPVVVHARQEITGAEQARLAALGEALTLKVARSADRLLHEVTLFLHRAHEALPPTQREALLRSLRDAPALVGRTMLVVDDDVRNIFTLGAVLEHYDVKVVPAENGREALDRLAERGDIDLVLMDIMMPEMDGYEATRRIRAQPGRAALPIIALTAKAMKGDREKCLRAGASDYIPKPVDPDLLVSMLRVWLPPRPDQRV